MEADKEASMKLVETIALVSTGSAEQSMDELVPTVIMLCGHLHVIPPHIPDCERKENDCNIEHRSAIGIIRKLSLHTHAA